MTIITALTYADLTHHAALRIWEHLATHPQVHGDYGREMADVYTDHLPQLRGDDPDWATAGDEAEAAASEIIASNHADSRHPYHAGEDCWCHDEFGHLYIASDVALHAHAYSPKAKLRYDLDCSALAQDTAKQAVRLGCAGTDQIGIALTLLAKNLPDPADKWDKLGDSYGYSGRGAV